MNRGRYIYNKGVKAMTTMIALLALWSCKPSVPSQYIQPDDMEDILYDYHLSQAIAQRNPDNTIDRSKYFYAVLAKYKVTEADFDSSMVYYYSNIPELQKIYSAVEERMDNEAAHLGATIATTTTTYSANGDTANVWKASTSAVLMPIAPYNRLDFALKVDTSYHKGDSFLMSFNTDYLYQSGTKDAVVYAAVTFDNDSTAQYYTHVTSSGSTQLRIPSNQNNSIRKVSGFIYLTQGNDDSKTMKLMFIDGISLFKFHTPKMPERNNPVGPSPTMEKPDSAKVPSPTDAPPIPTPGSRPMPKGGKPMPNGGKPMPNGGKPMPNGGKPMPPIKPIKNNVR